jgi:hypothetical protein
VVEPTTLISLRDNQKVIADFRQNVAEPDTGGKRKHGGLSDVVNEKVVGYCKNGLRSTSEVDSLAHNVREIPPAAQSRNAQYNLHILGIK